MQISTLEEINQPNHPYHFTDITQFIDEAIKDKPCVLMTPAPSHFRNLNDLNDNTKVFIYQLGTKIFDGTGIHQDGVLTPQDLTGKLLHIKTQIKDELTRYSVPLLIMPFRIQQGFWMWCGVNFDPNNPQIIIFGSNYTEFGLYTASVGNMLGNLFPNNANPETIEITVPECNTMLADSGPLVMQSIRYIAEQSSQTSPNWTDGLQDAVKQQSFDISTLRKRDSQLFTPLEEQSDENDENDIKINGDPKLSPFLNFIINVAGIPATTSAGFGTLLLLAGIGTLGASAAVPNPVLPIVGACLCLAGAALIIASFVLKFGAYLFDACCCNENEEEEEQLLVTSH